MKIYYDQDADLNILKNKNVVIIGYGSQGHAHALNMKDSGVQPVIALKMDDTEFVKKAQDAGFEVKATAEAVKDADVIALLVPDTIQKFVWEKDIKPNIKKGASLFFAHGFNIHYSQIVPSKDINICMCAPKGPGHTVRREYVNGNGVPSLIAVEQDATGDAKAVALSYAKAIGGTKAGVIETTFREETETDLFGEQVVLCGGLTSLILKGFETLVEAGYSAEMAYFETLHEVKLIVDLIYEGGIADMRYSISDTAEFGDLTRGPRVVNDETKQEMKKILSEIQDGSFATEWILENQAGRPRFNALRKQGQKHQIEEVGEKLRAMMSWIGKNKMVDKDKN